MVKLTPREAEIVELVVAGGGPKEIAADLGIARTTVKRHMQSACVKMGVENNGRARTGIKLANAARPTTGEFHCPAHITFTKREAQILPLVAQGNTSREIAALLGYDSLWGFQNVKNHVRCLFDKSGMSTRGELAAWYWSHCETPLTLPKLNLGHEALEGQ